jgi:hypothetical protein
MDSLLFFYWIDQFNSSDNRTKCAEKKFLFLPIDENYSSKYSPHKNYHTNYENIFVLTSMNISQKFVVIFLTDTHTHT